MWKLLDKKWELAEYKGQKAGELLNVLIIGAGWSSASVIATHMHIILNCFVVALQIMLFIFA